MMKKICWKIARNNKVKVLIDAQEYFKEFCEVVSQAEREIIILGWDINSNIIIDRKRKITLKDFLYKLTKEKKTLKIYILIWRAAPFFIHERELLAKYKFKIKPFNRIKFHLDDKHPFTAAHHHKIVVVDNKVAFNGGLDLTDDRYDTRKHSPRAHIRKNTTNKYYLPHHDVQVLVEGKAAQYLGDLARKRWEVARKRKIKPIKKPTGEIKVKNWHAKNCEIAISRTQPKFKNLPEIREIEKVYSELIKNAKKEIYIENQFLTARSIIQDLSKSLNKKEGPEITILLPQASLGVFTDKTIILLQNSQVKRLLDRDKHGRLRIYTVKNSEAEYIKLHDKLMIVDDQILHLGSANLTNRSMGLDTECDFTFLNCPELAKKIKYSLLNEFLHQPAEKIEKQVKKLGSLNKLLDRLCRKQKYIFPFETKDDGVNYHNSPESTLIDLESPLHVDLILDQVGEMFNRKKIFYYRSRKLLFGLFIGLSILTFTILIHLELTENPPVLSQFIQEYLESTSTRALSVLGIFAISTFFMVPINLLILATATIFPTFTAIIISLIGSLTNGSIGYLIGSKLRKKSDEYNLINAYTEHLKNQLLSHEIVTTLILRFIPLFPYSLTNIFAGNLKINFPRFLIGTTIGLLPGIIILTYFQKSLFNFILNPSLSTALILITIIFISIIAVQLIKRRLAKT